MFTEQDTHWMQLAILQAEKAASLGEVPVGAILVLNNELIAASHNTPIAKQDPTAHAEILALRTAAEKINNYRLVDATLYVTLEPCLMCCGAMVHARIKRLVYGAADGKAGAVVSQTQALDHTFLNHRVDHSGGLLAAHCGMLLSQFFQSRRASKN